jgi:2-haloalkanoic acid dehalogenase type II
MEPRYQAVAFDLYGTLLDVSGLVARIETAAAGQQLPGGSAGLLASWRRAQLERTWLLNRHAAYEPFDEVTRLALDEVAPGLDAGLKRKLCALWLSLPAFPDAAQTLSRLAKAGLRTAVLSNGTEAMIKSALDAAGLHVSAVLSVDQVRAYKPKHQTYALLDGLAPRDRLLFVSGNGWDVDGCKGSGRSAAFIDRGLPPPKEKPDLRVASLAALADAVVPDPRLHGVRIVSAQELDPNTAQTPGMTRAAAINFARAGAQKLWAGTVVIHPNAKTGAHHHGEVESVIYVVRGRARMRWGDRLEYTAEAGPGDFIYVPPYLPHQEMNASRDAPLECVLVRSGQDPVVVNLDLVPEEEPEVVRWVDDLHRG